MLKSVKWIFVVLLISSLISFVGKDTATSGLNVGDKAPSFIVKSTDRVYCLEEQKGKYTLLSFWASYDAQSRMSNASLSHVVKAANSQVEMVSVSFDEYRSVFDETIKKDQIDSTNIYLETSGKASKLYDTYRIDKGFNNYLLDDKGVIVAKNIKASELLAYLN